MKTEEEEEAFTRIFNSTELSLTQLSLAHIFNVEQTVGNL